MASGLSSVVVLALCVFLVPCVSAGDYDCEDYKDFSNIYHSAQKCGYGFCCGTCSNRYCCSKSVFQLTKDSQEDCDAIYPSSPLAMVVGISGFITVLLIFICCCVCPCCCLYKMCRKPRPVIATTTHTTMVTSTPQQYPQQPVVSPRQPQYQYPPYQPVPVQPGYGSQPMSQGYGSQPMPTMPYQAQPFAPGPPPTYQEASEFSPVYPPNPMPYSQAAFNPGQPAYPLQPPVQPPQPNAPPAQPDYLAQPAYNPDYAVPPRTG